MGHLELSVCLGVPKKLHLLKTMLSLIDFKNLLNLSSIKNYEIIEKDIYKDKLELDLKDKFDLIFLDPPYKDKNLIELFKKLEILKF